MENTTSNPTETAPAPAASTPEVVAAPVSVPVGDLAGSIPRTDTPKASPLTSGLGAGAPAPVKTAPVATGPVEMPKTTGKTPGGWNRFAGYNPHDAKNKKDNRGGSGRR